MLHTKKNVQLIKLRYVTSRSKRNIIFACQKKDYLIGIYFIKKIIYIPIK